MPVRVRVSRLLDLFGLADTQWFTAESRERGQVVHHISEEVLRRRPVTVPPAFDGYAEALAAGFAAIGFEPAMIEVRLTLQHGVLQLTGRPDAIGMVSTQVGGIYPGPAIIDVKSGERCPSHGVQLAIYERLADAAPALREALGPGWDAWPWQRIGLYVQPTGRYTLHPFTDPNDMRLAEALLDIAAWRAVHGLLDASSDTYDDDPTDIPEEASA